jgi:nucleoside-diphosphate-sugar epimerase
MREGLVRLVVVFAVIAKSPLYKFARNEIFNVGADIPYSLNDLALHVARAMGVQSPEIVHLQQRMEVVHSTVDNNKVRCYLQLEKPVELQVGLNFTAAWVHKIGKKVTISHTSADNPFATAHERDHGTNIESL